MNDAFTIAVPPGVPARPRAADPPDDAPHGAARDWWRRAAEDVERPCGTSAWTFAALWVYSVVLIAAPQEFLPALAPLRLALLVGLIAIAFHLADRWASRVGAPWPLEVRLVLLLLLWALLSVPFSYWPSGSLAVIGNLYLKSIAVFVLLASTVDTWWRCRRIAEVLTACGAIIAFTAIDHYRAGVLLPGTTDRIAGYGTSALASNPNDLALLLNLVLPFAVALAAVRRRAVWRAAAGVAALLMAAGIVVTLSRAGSLTLLVSLTWLGWRLVRRAGLLSAAAVLVIVAGVSTTLPSIAGGRLETVLDISRDSTGSAQARWADTIAAAGFALEHPFIGAGAGMDYLALNEVRGNAWLSVHNAYLNYAVDLGAIGLALFLALFWLAYRGVARVERRWAGHDARSDAALFAMAARVSLVAFAIAAFFHPIAYHAYFYYVAGAAVAIRYIASKDERPS